MGKKTVAAALAGAFGAGMYLTFYEVMGRDARLFGKFAEVFNKKNPPAKEISSSANQEKLDWFHQQEFQEFEMVSDRGLKLKGYLLPAEKPSDVYVFCSHGYRSTGRGEYRYFSKYYHDKGYNLFYVDHQAAGESEGKYIGFGYHEYKDCLKWLDFMNKTFGPDIQIFLHGVSMGSATVMMMTGSPDLPSNVKFTVADCGYTSAWDQFDHNLEVLGIFRYPVLWGSDVWNKLINGYHYTEANPLQSVANAKIPMLFVHGDKDNFVPTEMVWRLYNACSAPYKDVFLIAGAAHAEAYKVDPVTYEAKLDEFTEKFLNK